MKAPSILLPAMALLLAWPVTGGQRPQLLDPPDTQSAPDVLQRLPLDPDARRALEKSLGAHDFSDAESILLKEIERNPKSPGLLTFVGGVFFLDGKYLNSAVAMKKAEALAPLDDRSRFTLAMAYITLNHRDWARPELETLARSDPRTALYSYWLSRLDYDAMDFPSAIRHAQKALELDPSFTKAYDNLGLCYEAVGKYEEAIRAYGRAVRLNQKDRPCSPWPSLDLGALLVKLDRLGEAEESLTQSLKCDPRLPRAHYEMGRLLEKRQQDDQAVLELQQAASLDPSYAEPYYVLGRIYQREGDTRKAAEAWATFQKLERAEPRGRPH
ncbi:MAG TPA: tetratricopeptide repeat protein [Terriglobia bacterium]|nr:tetratricopeptide repeat protein [Terriglobia bacterium]